MDNIQRIIEEQRVYGVNARMIVEQMGEDEWVAALHDPARGTLLKKDDGEEALDGYGPTLADAIQDLEDQCAEQMPGA